MILGTTGVTGLIPLLIQILILGVILYVVNLVLNMITLPPPVKTIAWLIIGLLVLVWLLRLFGIAI